MFIIVAAVMEFHGGKVVFFSASLLFPIKTAVLPWFNGTKRTVGWGLSKVSVTEGK
jgi:hypothetical protein